MAIFLRNLPVLKTLDVDEDGQLSPAEIENASKSLLKLDKNGDGILSTEEMRPDPTQMPMFAPGGGPPNNLPGPELMMRMFEGRDRNKDGKLTDDEIPPQMLERMSNIDQNNDGQIDRSEIEQAMRRLEGMRPGNRPDRPGTGGQNIQPRRPQADPAANKA
jgi:Ca2+-binding EF-hand superfamily protein